VADTIVRDPSDKIHGHPVVRATPFVRRRGCLDTRAVLVDKGDGELVTALHAKDGDGRPHHEWFWGHYFRDRGAEAVFDFASRAHDLLDGALAEA
jgi:hypothetical protein